MRHWQSTTDTKKAKRQKTSSAQAKPPKPSKLAQRTKTIASTGKITNKKLNDITDDITANARWASENKDLKALTDATEAFSNLCDGYSNQDSTAWAFFSGEEDDIGELTGSGVARAWQDLTEDGLVTKDIVDGLVMDCGDFSCYEELFKEWMVKGLMED